MTTSDDASASQLPALQRIKQKLERAGAKLPIESQGTAESAITAGMSMALLLVDDEIQTLNDSDDPPESVQVCYQAYQVVGSLLVDLNLFGTEEAGKILDNLSQARLVHHDVLPWDPTFEIAPAAGAPLAATAVPVAWNHITAELAAIYGEMAAINETPAKDQADGQRERLKVLRAEAVAIGERRYAMVAGMGRVA